VVVFGLFAAVQYNDPDWLVWMLGYGYAAFIAVYAGRGRYLTPLAVLGLVVYSAWLFLINPSFDRRWLQSEEAREGAGLLICALWMIVLLAPAIHVKARSKAL